MRHVSGRTEEDLVSLLNLGNRNALARIPEIIVGHRASGSVESLRLARHLHSGRKPERRDKAPVHEHIAPCVALLGGIVGPPFCMIPRIFRVIVPSGVGRFVIELGVCSLFEITDLVFGHGKQLFDRLGDRHPSPPP